MKKHDLSPFILKDFIYKNLTLSFKKPLTIKPNLDKSKKLICLEYPKLGIDVYASTRKKLEKELDMQILFLWRCYALRNENMTTKAKELKQCLLKNIQEAVAAK